MIVGGGSNGSVCFYDHRSSQRTMKFYVPSDGERRSRIVKLHPLSNGKQIITSSMNSKVCFFIQFQSHRCLAAPVGFTIYGRLNIFPRA